MGRPDLDLMCQIWTVPLNLDEAQARKLRNRAAVYTWNHAADKGYALNRSRKGKPVRICPAPWERQGIVQRLHSEAHQGADSVFKRVGAAYFWPFMRISSRSAPPVNTKEPWPRLTKSFTPSPACQRESAFTLTSWGPFPEGPNGEKYTVVAMDSCAKYPEASAIKTKEPYEIEAFVFRDIVCRYPVQELIHDNGGEFAGEFA